MRRSKAQLNAISRSYSAKEKEVLNIQAKERGLDQVYKDQKQYSTLRGLLKAKGPKLEKSFDEAIDTKTKRVDALIANPRVSKERIKNEKLELRTLKQTKREHKGLFKVK